MTREVAGSKPAGCVERLYVVARVDLAVGLRTAQVGHALIGYVLEYGEPPENLVVLQVADESALRVVLERVSNDRHHAFYEPDLAGELTAIAVAPEQWRKLSALPCLR